MTSAPDAVTCGKGCGKEWPRDPVLEVPCPECLAPIGVRCKRPSGHTIWGKEPHASRDILADRNGCYGPCPRKCCGLENVGSKQDKLGSDQLNMFQ